MTSIKPRPPQTKVKHTILEKYLNAWGGILINGLRKQLTNIHLVYIDCNASTGRFVGELEDVVAKREAQLVYGSPIIGVRTLDSLANWARETVGINIRTTSILLENDAQTFNDLKESLVLAGLAHKIRETSNFSSLRDGEIAVLCEDSTFMASQLVKYTQSGHKFSFFVLDPYGPKGIPLSFVGEIVRHPRHDVLINMPYQDLLKKSGIVPKQKRSSIDEKLLENYNAMFGHRLWQTIVKELDTDAMREGQKSLHTDAPFSQKTMKARDLELNLMNCYKESLLSVDQNLTVKSIGLRFPDKERTMFYLYLTTHDPTGAFKMNEVLWEAGYQEHELRWGLKESKKLKDGQLMMFDIPAPPLQTSQRVSIEEIATHILRLPTGKFIKKRDIYTALVDELYFAKEIDQALRLLRKQKKISFESSLTNDTLITIEVS